MRSDENKRSNNRSKRLRASVGFTNTDEINNDKRRTNMEMIAWPTGEHEKIRARIARHRELDEIIQGTGWNGRIGCAIGCSLDKYDHEEFANVLIGNNDRNDGIKIALLIDRLHELLPFALSLDWPGRVAHALTPGADTTHVLSRWFVWLLRVELKDHDAFGYCAKVAALYECRLAGDEPSATTWSSVYDDAADIAALAALASYAYADATATHSAANAAVAAAHAVYGVHDGSYAYAAANADAADAIATRMANALIAIMSANN